MHARSKTFKLAPAKMNKAVSAFKKSHLRQYKAQKGYKGVTLLGDRTSGRVRMISHWDNKTHLAASAKLCADAAKTLRATGGASGRTTNDEWEVL